MKGVWGLCRSLSFAFEDDTAGDLLCEYGWKDQSVTVLFKLTVYTGSVIHLVQEEKRQKLKDENILKLKRQYNLM